MTDKQAYIAMQYFLEKFYERTGSDDIGGLLGDMILISEDETMDPAVWHDWLNAVNKVKAQEK